MLRWLAIGLAVTSCESGPRSLPESPGAPEPAHTRDQVIAANDLQLAISRGRLVEARDLAAVVATATPVDVQQAADRIAHAGDLPAAALELGRLAGACGGCHASAGVSAELRVRTMPAESTSLVAQMARHAWGVARLWEGVTGPADRAWTDGAAVISETPCDISTVVHEKPNTLTFELAEQLRDQGIRAAGAADLTARATLYGEVMSTCASCHQILRPHPIVDTHRDAVARTNRATRSRERH